MNAVTKGILMLMLATLIATYIYMQMGDIV